MGTACPPAARAAVFTGQKTFGTNRSRATFSRYKKWKSIEAGCGRDRANRQTHLVKLMDKVRKQGVVKPSPLSKTSPVALAWKKDGSLRVVVGYGNRNEMTKKDPFCYQESTTRRMPQLTWIWTRLVSGQVLHGKIKRIRHSPYDLACMNLELRRSDFHKLRQISAPDGSCANLHTNGGRLIQSKNTNVPISIFVGRLKNVPFPLGDWRKWTVSKPQKMFS